MYRTKRLFNDRGNKFNAKSTTVDGKKFDSMKEARYYKELLWRKKAGEVKEIETQVKIELKRRDGKKACSYYADFVITLADDTVQIIDVKSAITATPLFKLKWALLEGQLQETYPGAEMLIVY